MQARQITYTTAPQAQTVTATGMAPAQGVQATGTLTFYNGKTVSQTVSAGTFFMNSQRVQIIIDAPVTIPAAIPPVEGQITVKAHAVNIGMSGNIAALAINEDCCTLDHTIFVKNLSPFMGGEGSPGYYFVQQSDIGSAASSLEQSLTPTAQSSLQSQIHPDEVLVAPVQCNNAVTSNHKVGDKANDVTVTVVVTCTGEVYNRQQAVNEATNSLKQEAEQSLGFDYAQANAIKATVLQTVVTNAKEGTISLQVKATGLWVYQFTNVQIQKLVKLIAGKTWQDAINVLKRQPGITDAQIMGTDDPLPTDPTKITIKIGSVKEVSS